MPAYSNTPLAKKLGIKERDFVFLVHAPTYYTELFSDMPTDVQFLEVPPAEETVDFIHFFGKSQLEYVETISRIIPYLKKEGTLWVSWPKGASGIKTDLKRDWIRTYILELGLVDVKVASVDDIWSGLKFVYRLKDR